MKYQFNETRQKVSSNMIAQKIWATKVVSLCHEITLQVPMIYTDPRMMQLSIDLAQEIMMLMSRYFGGSTGSQTIGTYEDEKGRLIKDVNVFIKSYCDAENFERYLPIMIDLAKKVGRQLNQESVMMTIDNSCYLLFMQDSESA
jgi:hypothetical protein